MDRMVKQLNQSRIPIDRVRWNSRISSPFHQYVFRDQHKLNFGTKFHLEGKTVTTHHFRLFQVISRTLEKHYSSNTIHQNTIHQFTIHHFRGQFDIPRSIQKILLFMEHYSLREKISSFTSITHFIVNLVYGYSNSRNRIGSGANSCIISNDISYGLGIVCISSVGHLHVIPLSGFSNFYIQYI
jgi:hypothetical protein